MAIFNGQNISRNNILVNMEFDVANRKYKMNKRAKALDNTRARIVQATMQLHDELGVAATSHADIAARAEVGAATVYRHFPTIGSLVMACGAHVWETIQPPLAEDAPTMFAGLSTLQKRLERLVRELHAFYARSALRLTAAARDRNQIPELDAFLSRVETGIEALVREALRPDKLPETTVQRVLALTDVSVWFSMQRRKIPPAELESIIVLILNCAIGEV